MIRRHSRANGLSAGSVSRSDTSGVPGRTDGRMVDDEEIAEKEGNPKKRGNLERPPVRKPEMSRFGRFLCGGVTGKGCFSRSPGTGTDAFRICARSADGPGGGRIGQVALNGRPHLRGDRPLDVRRQIFFTDVVIHWRLR